MEATKSALETAISDSSASDYDKGNILYLAEEYAKAREKVALDTIAEYEAKQS